MDFQSVLNLIMVVLAAAGLSAVYSGLSRLFGQVKKNKQDAEANTIEKRLGEQTMKLGEQELTVKQAIDEFRKAKAELDKSK